LKEEKKPAKTEEVKAKIRGLVQQAMQEALEGELEEFLREMGSGLKIEIFGLLK
jgi:hypothetical protein